jgi:hypothetical protein
MIPENFSSRQEIGMQLQREQVIEQLYNQKEFAFHFSKYLQEMWGLLTELPVGVLECLKSKIGRDRVSSILNGDIQPAYDDNIALIDLIPDDLRKEIYQGIELKPKKKEFYKRKKREMNGLVKIIDEVSGDQIVDIAGGAGDMGRILSILTKKPKVVWFVKTTKVLV